MEAQPKAQAQGTISLDPRYTDTAFTRVPNWLLEQLGTISRDARYTFIVLLKYARQDGHCWPGMETLSADLGASRQSVSRWINELEMVGLVEVKRRGMGRTNDYAFHWPDWLDADVNPGLHQPQTGAGDVTPGLHHRHDVNQVLHHRHGTDVTPGLPSDVTPGLHNIDTSTKTHTIATVPPIVMSTKRETSARTEDSSNKQHARARKGRSRVMSRGGVTRPTPLHQGAHDIDPQEPWLKEMVQAVHEHWGGAASVEEQERWAEELWTQLKGCTQQERCAFQAYLFDGPYLRERSNPSAVETTIRQDAERWKLRGKPSSKSSVGTSAPKVPAHVQWEHDHAHNPKSGKVDANSPPEVIERIATHLRKTSGEEKAQAWLRSLGLTGRGA